MSKNDQQLNFLDKNLGRKLNIKLGYLLFMKDENQLIFCDENGKYYKFENVFGLSNERNYENGIKDLPRPYIMVKNEIKEVGDNLLYTFIDDANQNILILGSMTNWKLDAFDPLLKVDTTKKEGLGEKYISRNNKQRFFSIREDAKGNFTITILGKNDKDLSGSGNLSIKVKGTDQSGNVNLTMNGKFAITQTQMDGENEVVVAQLLMDNTKEAEKIKVIDKYKNRIEMTKDGIIVQDKTKNKIEMNKNGVIVETTSVRIGKSETIAKILLDLITQIRSLKQGTAAGGPTITPPFNDAQFQGIVNRINKFMDTQ